MPFTTVTVGPKGPVVDPDSMGVLGGGGRDSTTTVIHSGPPLGVVVLGGVLGIRVQTRVPGVTVILPEVTVGGRGGGRSTTTPHKLSQVWT